MLRDQEFIEATFDSCGFTSDHKAAPDQIIEVLTRLNNDSGTKEMRCGSR